jgi:hypothetical protein
MMEHGSVLMDLTLEAQSSLAVLGFAWMKLLLHLEEEVAKSA